jgi:LPPG:FO 2-phospho-L-lactate transferase
MIAALAGGVGAARFLAGLSRVVPPGDTVAVVNTGDDDVFFGLHVSPDLDTVTYTLAGAVNPATGWGLEADTFSTMEDLERYGAATWFRLGDRDLATHLYRTGRLAEGVSLSAVTAEIARAWGVAVRLLPMSDDSVRTRVVLRDGPEVSFQEYFVRLHHQAAVAAVRFEGAATARPAPGVLEALGDAQAVVVCPSNPFLSIGPVLAVPGVRERLEGRRATTVAVSPIVAGAALKGPADRLMAELGYDTSVVGVARLYAPLAAILVVDEADAPLAPAVEAAGMRCVVTPSVMTSPQVAAGLAAATLQAVGA